MRPPRAKEAILLLQTSACRPVTCSSLSALADNGQSEQGSRSPTAGLSFLATFLVTQGAKGVVSTGPLPRTASSRVHAFNVILQALCQCGDVIRCGGKARDVRWPVEFVDWRVMFCSRRIERPSSTCPKCDQERTNLHPTVVKLTETTSNKVFIDLVILATIWMLDTFDLTRFSQDKALLHVRKDILRCQYLAAHAVDHLETGFVCTPCWAKQKQTF